jgi:hypothetical protein
LEELLDTVQFTTVCKSKSSVLAYSWNPRIALLSSSYRFEAVNLLGTKSHTLHIPLFLYIFYRLSYFKSIKMLLYNNCNKELRDPASTTIKFSELLLFTSSCWTAKEACFHTDSCLFYPSAYSSEKILKRNS